MLKKTVMSKAVSLLALSRKKNTVCLYLSISDIPSWYDC